MQFFFHISIIKLYFIIVFIYFEFFLKKIIKAHIDVYINLNQTDCADNNSRHFYFLTKKKTFVTIFNISMD